MTSDGPFRLDPRHDAAALSATFAAKGRVRIRGLLVDATYLAAHLGTRDDWRQVLNAGEKVYELDRATRAGMAPERKAALDAAVYAGAAAGFQYRFESIRVPDGAADRAAREDLLTDFACWLSHGPMRDFLRHVTGATAIDFADAQATQFSGGDFLTAHDDMVSGKSRHAAYVFGLTPAWRIDWGGLLLFHDEGDDGVSGMMPAFNTLDLFAVPTPHSVSLVSPAAIGPRVSVTRWLRSAA